MSIFRHTFLTCRGIVQPFETFVVQSCTHYTLTILAFVFFVDLYIMPNSVLLCGTKNGFLNRFTIIVGCHIVTDNGFWVEPKVTYHRISWKKKVFHKVTDNFVNLYTYLKHDFLVPYVAVNLHQNFCYILQSLVLLGIIYF